jgi:hypothetical protein
MKATMLPDPTIAATGDIFESEPFTATATRSGRVQNNRQKTAACIDPIAKPKQQIKLTRKVGISQAR